MTRDVDLSDLDEGIIHATGVGLREGELRALKAIGEALGEEPGTAAVARNALVRIAVRELIARYRAGEADLQQYFEKPDQPKPRTRF